MFTGLSSYALLPSDDRSFELTSSRIESQTSSSISPHANKQRLLSPQRSLSQRLSTCSLRSKTRRRTEPIPSTPISIFKLRHLYYILLFPKRGVNPSPRAQSRTQKLLFIRIFPNHGLKPAAQMIPPSLALISIESPPEVSRP
jgi:hypothetical protein